MDWELAKRLRKVAKEHDLANREGEHFLSTPNTCACGDLLTVEDGVRCRQCVLMSRMFAEDAA